MPAQLFFLEPIFALWSRPNCPNRTPFFIHAAGACNIRDPVSHRHCLIDCIIILCTHTFCISPHAFRSEFNSRVFSKCRFPRPALILPRVLLTSSPSRFVKRVSAQTGWGRAYSPTLSGVSCSYPCTPRVVHTWPPLKCSTG